MNTQENLFLGNWKANLEKSNCDPNHRPASATMRFERTPRGIHMRAEGVHEGKPVVDQQEFILDGQEHSIPGMPGLTAYWSQPDARTLRAVGRKDGQVVGEGTYTVSQDGRMLTAAVRGIDAQQRPFETVMVWDRE